MLHYTINPQIEAFSTERWDGVMEGIVLPVQTHSCNIAVAREAGESLDTDALVTDVRGLTIGVRTADCVPVLLADTKRGVVAAVHAGWRGTVGQIGRKTVECMVDDFGCLASDIRAVIGPSISPESFEVGEEVVQEFLQAGFRDDIVLRNYAKPHIDLWKANQWLLMEAGIPAVNIEVAGICTMLNNDRFFSARKEGVGTGRIISGIRIL